ncbi:hypothetical protein [Planctomyces sp. SH-PL62]|uniref:hypothetical protein n=1 Tax=Planctomyces sp. SH-PL62 TaxID=1636152 RepID=UPI00078D2E28|nr:hypothetical protein [Planctomyces sp. SH-PL62]AMV36351.1 hypothetical protein VT85_02855 [Planctomyces sp. SH-PL62]
MSEPTPTSNRPVVTPAPISRAAYVLLGAMTLVSFGGPFFIALILYGGERSGWPPDRTVEWVGVLGVLALFTVCLVACITIRLWLVNTSGDPKPKP